MVIYTARYVGRGYPKLKNKRIRILIKQIYEQVETFLCEDVSTGELFRTVRTDLTDFKSE